MTAAPPTPTTAGGGTAVAISGATTTGAGTMGISSGATTTGATAAGITAATAAASSVAALAASRIVEASWMSDTELVSGKIPAVLESDYDLGIQTNVSTVVELEDVEETSAPIARVSGTPLSGAVSRTVNAARTMRLNRGAVVFAPASNTVVITPFGKVKIDARSIVLIIAFHNGLSVFNVDELHGRSVIVQAGHNEVAIGPGMHATVTSDAVKGLDEVNPAQLIGHHHIRACNLGAGLQSFVSEFSLAQAFSAVMPLQQLANSRHPQAAKIARHMFKTAAILMQMHNVEYQRVLRPTLTAYAKTSLPFNSR